MIAMIVPAPIAGYVSSSWSTMRYTATKASDGREHLDQQQGEHAGPAAAEAQPRERVRRGATASSTVPNATTTLTMSELKNQFQYG